MKSFAARFNFLRRKKKKKSSAIKSPSLLDPLPAELKQQMASFLSVRDLLNLAQTSKCMKKDLGVIVVSSPLTDRASQAREFSSTKGVQCFAAVIPNQESHSYAKVFTCQVNQFLLDNFHEEGVIWIVEQDLPKNMSLQALRNLRFSSGNVVANADPTQSKNIVLPFFPKPGKLYQFWIDSEDMFLHQYTRWNLRINNIKLHSVGLAKKPSGHTAFQFEVVEQPYRIEAMR